MSSFDELVGRDPSAALERACSLQSSGGAAHDPRVTTWAMIWQAEALQRLGDAFGSALLVRRVLELADDLPREIIVRASWLLARVYTDVANYPTALEHALDAAAALDDDVSRLVQTRVLIKVADLLGFLGNLSEARIWYGRAETLATGDASLHQLVINNQTYGEMAAGKVERAEAGVLRLIEVSNTYACVLDARSLDTIARVYLLSNQFEKARVAAQMAISAAAQQKSRNPEDFPEHFFTLATTQRLSGDMMAAANLREARACLIAEENGDLRARLLQEEAEILAAQGSFRAAFVAHKAFHEVDRQLVSHKREFQVRARHALYETTAARSDAANFRAEARRDPLTGLPNRLHINEHVPLLLDQSHRAGLFFAAAILDVDHFKAVNDHFSHEVGDNVLVAVAKILKRAAEEDSYFVSRLGGEEFLVLISVDTREGVLWLVEKLRRRIERHDWSALVLDRVITISAGVAFAAVSDGQTELLRNADNQLYKAKTLGRNQVSALPAPSVRDVDDIGS